MNRRSVLTAILAAPMALVAKLSTRASEVTTRAAGFCTPDQPCAACVSGAPTGSGEQIEKPVRKVVVSGCPFVKSFIGLGLNDTDGVRVGQYVSGGAVHYGKVAAVFGPYISIEHDSVPVPNGTTLTFMDSL